MVKDCGFCLGHSHAQTLRSLALAEAARWCLRPCSVPYQKMQDKSDKLVSSDFTGKLLLPRLLPKVMSLIYDKMFENII